MQNTGLGTARMLSDSDAATTFLRLLTLHMIGTAPVYALRSLCELFGVPQVGRGRWYLSLALLCLSLGISAGISHLFNKDCCIFSMFEYGAQPQPGGFWHTVRKLPVRGNNTYAFLFLSVFS